LIIKQIKHLIFKDLWSILRKSFGGREVAGSNPVAPINAVKSRVCGLSVLMKNRKVIKKAIKSKKGNHFL